ncbi:hypothetical protein GWK47_029862 [Chionoecetes opilio]|uniref:THAP-type domain-containing protein n=1 Tax=Chionoecetes opilio TaxID=41210 RepID=A0A8J4YL75_CHIOP|nr:hypothetical protein GWK47_029862 [Chionoecetes opilio]
MAPSGRSGICCACGKKRSNHPGIRLHLFPIDARRRMQWMRTLDIAFERSSQTICEDHFDAKWLGTKGKLVGNAVPRPAECPDAPSMDHAIDAAPMSEMQHLSLVRTTKICTLQCLLFGRQVLQSTPRFVQILVVVRYIE